MSDYLVDDQIEYLLKLYTPMQFHHVITAIRNGVHEDNGIYHDADNDDKVNDDDEKIGSNPLVASAVRARAVCQD